MKSVLLFITILVLTGCATGYVPAEGGSYGYRVKPLQAKKSYYTHISTYIGNTSTGKSSARVYSKFAAVEFCEQQSMLAVLADDVDLSKNFQSLQTGWNGSYAYSYNTIETMPAFMVMFRCDDKLLMLPQRITTAPVKAELMKDYVSDFLGALQVKSVETSGALQENDVILSVDGKRVTNFLNLMNHMAEIEGISAKLKLIRDKKIISKTVTLMDRPNAIKKVNEDVKFEKCVVDAGGLMEECKVDFGRKRSKN